MPLSFLSPERENMLEYLTEITPLLLLIAAVYASYKMQFLIFRIIKKRSSLLYVPKVSFLITLALIIWVFHTMNVLSAAFHALLFVFYFGAIIIGSIIGGLVVLKKKENRDIQNSNPDSSEDIPK